MRSLIAFAACVAVLAVPPLAAAQDASAGSSEAYLVCPKLALYAASHDADGAWRGVRVEDSRSAPTAVYTAESAEPVTAEGQPALLLHNGRVALGPAPALSFDEIVIGACPEASLRAQTAG